jgi:hypothetical protein
MKRYDIRPWSNQPWIALDNAIHWASETRLTRELLYRTQCKQCPSYSMVGGSLCDREEGEYINNSQRSDMISDHGPTNHG